MMKLTDEHWEQIREHFCENYPVSECAGCKLNHKNRVRHKTREGRLLGWYVWRWKVERFFAWQQWRYRVVTRWEYHPKSFLGFVQLASLLILFR